MINIATQTKWYSDRAKRLNYHVAGMKATRLIPEYENQLLISETKQRAFGRHRILRGSLDIEKFFGEVIKLKLVIVRAVAKAYVCRGGVKHGSKKQE